MSPVRKNHVAVSDSVSSRVLRALRKNASRKLSGFTLAELIVVVTVLAVLSAVGFVALSGYSRDAALSAAKANVRSVYSAISAESASTGRSPRYYVVHDPALSLTWGAVAAFDGALPTALTGGQWDAAGTNYSAGAPDYAKLRLDASKFRISAGFPERRPFPLSAPSASASSAPSGPFVWAVDAVRSLSGASARPKSYLQVAAILPGGTVVAGDYPVSSASAWGVAGLVKDPAAASSTGALVDGSAPSGAPSGIPAPTPAYCGGFLLRENQAMKVYLNVDEACVDADSWKASTKQTLAWIWGSYDRYGILDPWGELSNTNNDHGYFWINNGSQDYFEIYNNQWKKYFWMWKESGAFNFKAVYLDTNLPSNRMFVTFSQPQANTGFEYYFGEYGEWPMIKTDASGDAQYDDGSGLWTPYAWTPIPASVNNVYVEYVKVCPIWQQINRDGSCGPFSCNLPSLSNFLNYSSYITGSGQYPYSNDFQRTNSLLWCYVQCWTGQWWKFNSTAGKWWCEAQTLQPWDNWYDYEYLPIGYYVIDANDSNYPNWCASFAKLVSENKHPGYCILKANGQYIAPAHQDQWAQHWNCEGSQANCANYNNTKWPAASFCDKLDIWGISNWRLPNMWEVNANDAWLWLMRFHSDKLATWTDINFTTMWPIIGRWNLVVLNGAFYPNYYGYWSSNWNWCSDRMCWYGRGIHNNTTSDGWWSGYKRVRCIASQ